MTEHPVLTGWLARVFCGFGTLGTFVTMCVVAVEITSARHKSLVSSYLLRTVEIDISCTDKTTVLTT